MILATETCLVWHIPLSTERIALRLKPLTYDAPMVIVNSCRNRWRAVAIMLIQTGASLVRSLWANLSDLAIAIMRYRVT